MTIDRFPLTPLQHAMVGAWLRRPRSGLNVEQWIVTLRETVDADALRAAWNEVVQSYGMLRASIDLRDPANPRQTIHDDLERCDDETWETLDWRDRSADAIAADWQAFLESDRERGLKLTQAPLWRVKLIRTADDEYRFVCTYHHVLLGGRSLVQLGRELFARYDARLHGEPCPMEPEAPFYKFVERLHEIDATQSASYWRRYLADRPPVRLPEPHGPAAPPDAAGRHRSLELERTLDAAATARLYAAARGADVTLHSLVQAAWGLTLAAFTGETDHTFGSVRACRKLNVEGIPRMVGMLINTVPFRVQLRRDETVEALLARLREAQVEHRLHETISAGDVARFVRQPADEPLFPTLVMFTDRRPETMLHTAGRPHPTRGVQLLECSEFPLALAVGADEITEIRLEYDADRYDAATAERIIEHFVMTLAALPDGLDRPVDELPSVTPADRERLLAWSRPAQSPAIKTTVADMVERRCLACPDDPAFLSGERTVNYRTLRTLAATAARRLRELGVRRGDLVGVFCDRSPEMTALVLGVWRLGAVYVPLDPKYPSQRLAAIVADSSPALIVHDRPAVDELRTAGSRLVPLAALFDNHRIDGDDEPLAATLADRAVVLYTSGSTGKPKGVVLTHRNLANHNVHVTRTLELAAGDRLAPVSSINFDASLEEHFCPLAAGATIVLPLAGDLDSCARFVDFAERHQLTILDLPTSLWRELTNYLHDERREYPAGVRAIMMGGEAATRAVYNRFLQVGGRRIRWINAYGPTETTICSTTYEHRPDRDATSSKAPPIGRPIDNTTVLVLDPRGRLVPPGVRGELYLGGAGVAQGYLNRDDLTAERFVELASGDMPAGRYYRTGDEVRFRADGELEYVGRLDGQVKLRGFRIEPGEIEAALLKHATVRDAAVVVLTSPAGTQYLAAYVVLHGGAAWDERALREFAAARLPQYMVPKAFVELDVLPQTPNGKIDRRALPEPVLAVHDATDSGLDPQRKPTLLERRLLDVWRSTLKVDDLGLDDDFFLLGGDSLRAMTLVAKLEQALGRTVTAAALMAAPTVAKLAARLEADAATDADNESAGLVLLREGDGGRPLFFVHSLAGDVWIYRDLVHALRTDAAVYGLQMPGLDGADTLPSDDVEAWAARYVDHVRSLQPIGPYRVIGYSSGGIMAYEIARQLIEAGERVEFLGLIDSGVPTVVERRLAPSRVGRCLRVLRALPALAGELRKRPLGELRRSVARRLVGRYRRCFANRRAAAAMHGALDDRDVLECFAEDISFFPEERLDLIRRHYRALDRYEPSAVVAAACLFRSARQPMFALQTPTMGWEELVRGELSVYQIGGAHATLMRAPHVERLAAAIDGALRHCAQATMHDAALSM